MGLLHSPNDTIFTAIADFDNLVDESNEENNIIISSAPEKNDLDNDGISDDLDTLIGDRSSINTTMENLTIKIGDSADLSKNFNGTWRINFIENNFTIMKFDFNLSRMLNLTKIRVERQNNSSFGYTLAGGLKLEDGTKTLYVDRIDTAINGICIKDAEIASISQLSGNCSGANEAKVECDGTLQSSYVCSYNSTTAKYQIEGLNHSGIKQFNYAKPQSSAENSRSGGGGGTNSNGGSGSCLENWKCAEWSACFNSLQTRACSDINKCATLFSKPIEAKQCQTSKKPAETELIKKSEESNENNKESGNKHSLPGITGYLLSPQENANPGIGALVASAIVVVGLFGYFFLFAGNEASSKK